VLAPDARVVAMDLLRPPPGYALDQAVLTTYSLDLETLLALPLALLAHTDQGLDALLGDPLLVLEGLREAGGRIHVFVDEDGLAVPRAPRELYALLEPCVHPVRAPNRGSFHPKVWLARFVSAEGEARLRVAVLSRNLTFERSWDVALSSDAAPGPRRRHRATRELAELVAALPRLATQAVRAEVAVALAQLAEEVARTSFPSPERFAAPIVFHALGLSAGERLWQPLAGGSRLLAVAPFVKRAPLDALAELSADRTLVARQDQLDELPAAALEDWQVLVLADAALSEEEDEGPARPSGLHAKLLAVEHGWDVTWFLGSANLSEAAWRGRNVEVMAEIRAKKGRDEGRTGFGISRFFESGFRALCREYTRAEREPEDPAVTAAKRLLETTRRTLVAAELRIVCEPVGAAWRWRLEGSFAAPVGVTAEVWPISLLEEHARPLVPPVEWELPITRLTAFVAFRLRVPGSVVDAERLTRKLPAEGLPEGRINHVLRALIDSPERLLRFLRALLGGLEGLTEWTEGPGGASDAAWGVGLGGETLVEDLVRAASREPRRLEPIRRLLEDLVATEEGRALVPPGLLETWRAVEEALAEERP